MELSIKACLAHFPARIPTSEMQQYVTDEVLLKSRYIFVRRKGKRQFGYCTHCRSDFETTGLKHKAEAECPNCNSSCEVRQSRLGRSKLIDHAVFTYWLKSAIDPSIVVAIGVYVYRDYRKDYRETETFYFAERLYLFRAESGGTMLRRYMGKTNLGEILVAEEWQQRDIVRCYFYDNQVNGIPAQYSRDNLAQAVANTPFQYSTWERYRHGDMTMFLDLFARYPCVEYLTKLGFKALVCDKLYGGYTYSAVNWRGKAPHEVLKLSKQDLRTVMASKEDVFDCANLALLQISRRDGSNFSVEEIARLTVTYRRYLQLFIKAGKQTKLRKLVNYLTRQTADLGCHVARNPYYQHPNNALRAWMDYLDDCGVLGMNVTAERVLFPRNLHQAHQHTNARRRALEAQIREQEEAEKEQARLKVWEAQDKAVQRRAKHLAKKAYSQGAFLIRPLASRGELINEGNALRHCVANYAEQYANAKTELYALRRIEAPDVPYYTVEIHNGRVTQCYGKGNCRATDEVQAFMNAFMAAKLGFKLEQEEVAN